jgi:O-antigen ligase
MPAPFTGAAAKGLANRAGPWLAVAIGFSIPISTALDNLLVAALVLCWIVGGRYRERLAVIRANGFALAAIAFFLLHVVGALYTRGAQHEVLQALDKASVILLIPVLISLRLGEETRAHALRALMAAVTLTLILSILLWLDLLAQGGVFKGYPGDPEVFRKRITQSVLMAFGAFYFALKAYEAKDLSVRLALAFVAALAAFNILFMVHGRTGQLVLLLLVLYGLLSRFRGRGLLAGLAAGVALGASVYLVPSSSLHKRAMTTVQELQDWRAGKPATAANLRLEAWSNSLEVMKRDPIFGVGTGGFGAAYAKQVEGTAMTPLRQPESQYLHTGVQLGIAGLAGLLALFAYQWQLAARLATRLDTNLARGLVLAMLAGCLFNSFLLDHTEALFYAWLSGLLYAGLRPAAERG